MVSELGRFIAMKSALDVDLTGQLNTEALGKEQLGLVGGQVVHIRAANVLPQGSAIVALPATAGGASWIIERLSGPVTTARSDIGVVVTEYGAADLQGASGG